MKIKNLARIQAATILIACLFIHGADPVGQAATIYVAASALAWLFGYPLFFLLGEPGWE